MAADEGFAGTPGKSDNAAVRLSASLALAGGWFGHGRWSAPYWFIGMEPGGDEAEANLALWEAAGRPEFTDRTITHPDRPYDWFGPRSKPQKTWEKLIWLLLCYKNVDPTPVATLKYQREHLGRLDDETTLIELSPFAAVSTIADAPRELGRKERIVKIRHHLTADAPKFVVFYSTRPEYVDAWSSIATTSLAEGQPVLLGTTICVMTYHPQYKRGKAYWADIAARIRAARMENGLPI